MSKIELESIKSILSLKFLPIRKIKDLLKTSNKLPKTYSALIKEINKFDVNLGIVIGVFILGVVIAAAGLLTIPFVLSLGISLPLALGGTALGGIAFCILMASNEDNLKNKSLKEILPPLALEEIQAYIKEHPRTKLNIEMTVNEIAEWQIKKMTLKEVLSKPELVKIETILKKHPKWELNVDMRLSKAQKWVDKKLAEKDCESIDDGLSNSSILVSNNNVVVKKSRIHQLLIHSKDKEKNNDKLETNPEKNTSFLKIIKKHAIANSLFHKKVSNHPKIASVEKIDSLRKDISVTKR